MQPAVGRTVDRHVTPADFGAARGHAFGFGSEERIEADDLRCRDCRLVGRRPAFLSAEIGGEVPEDGPRLAADQDKIAYTVKAGVVVQAGQQSIR